MSSIELKPCPFCGDEKDLQILNTGDLVGWTCHYDCDKQMDTISKLNNQWFVNCPNCGACGPMYYVGGEFGEADCEICKAKAIEGWNRRGDNGLPYFEGSVLRFMRVPSTELIPLWTDTENSRLDGFIRFYDRIEYEGRNRFPAHEAVL